MFTIRKEFAFSASHQLKGLADNHPCSRNHGHNYVIVVELKSKELSDVGFILDYRQLDFVKKMIDEEFDHRFLNDVVSFNPTAESLSEYFYYRIKTHLVTSGKDESILSAVEVSETPKTNSRYYEPDNN